LLSSLPLPPEPQLFSRSVGSELKPLSGVPVQKPPPRTGAAPAPADVRSVPLPTFPLAFAPAPERAFVTTGDIHAMWLRDSTNQLLSYASLLGSDAAVRALFRATLATQAALVLADPFANAFNSPDSDGARRHAAAGFRSDSFASDTRLPRVSPLVFEGKYELDSLAAFLFLAGEYYERTGDLTVATGQLGMALESAARVISHMRGGVAGGSAVRRFVDHRDLRSPAATGHAAG
jgi:hypothetical protein